MENFSVDVDRNGIATIMFDVPGCTMNILTDSAIADLENLANHMRENSQIRGVILASGKDGVFCAGADMAGLAVKAGKETRGAERLKVLRSTSRMSRALRALETNGKPIAVALEGAALGEGFEFALAAHRRIAGQGVTVGLPQVGYGLLPGAGGTQRLARLAGALPALDLMLSGKPIDAASAHALGLIDELVDTGRAIDAARAWLLSAGNAIQRWDVAGYTTSDGPNDPGASTKFMFAAASIRANSYGNYPAHLNIARCIYEGFGLPMDAALRVEARLFLTTLETPQAKAMIRSMAFSRRALASGGARPPGISQTPPLRKVVILAAGTMGADIAAAQASAGIETVLVDMSPKAEGSETYFRNRIETAVAAVAMSIEEAKHLTSRISVNNDYSTMDDADLAVNAVCENSEGMQRADIGPPSAATMSNISTLPISGPAEESNRAPYCVDLHFVSYAGRADLVEIIVGDKMSQAALAKAIDYCVQIKRVPIVVKDSPGFYASRVFETYLMEGLELLLEGVAPAIIENVGRMTGMPGGPLELLDDVSIDILERICAQRRGNAPNTGPAKLLAEFVGLGRYGRKSGNGLYDYSADGSKRLWTGLSDLAPVQVARPAPELKADIRRRLLFLQAIEAARCMEENVIASAREADIGAILGWGFPPWTGGPMSLIDRIGLGVFVGKCAAFAVKHGSRFQPPKLLESMVQADKRFYAEGSMGIE